MANKKDPNLTILSARAAGATLTRNLLGGKRGSPELVGRVRLAVREMMGKREIHDLLEQRLSAELRGAIDKDDKMRIAPLMIKIAVDIGDSAVHAPGKIGPEKHLHLHGMAAEEAIAYAESRLELEKPEEP